MSEKELEEAILREKIKGTPDKEIGEKYNITFRQIERIITKSTGVNVSALMSTKKIKTLVPKNFAEETSTVWSFKQRGKWATHSGEYRGNWSPYIPRNVILKYSKPDETVLDYFCGAGTTAVEAKLLGRKCICFDINEDAIKMAKTNLDFQIHKQHFEPRLLVSDARDLSSLDKNSIHLICAHPPYANIIHYTDSKEGDLSFFDIDDFLHEMSKVAKESFRVLKPGRHCAILIGDTRRKKHIIPLGFRLIDVYLKAGFQLRELVVKRQHNCKTTGFWYNNSIKYNFLLLAHEYLPIFEKPKSTVSVMDKKRRKFGTSVVETSEKLKKKRKLDELETTTVWIFTEKDFEKQLNKNVVDRYCNGYGYSSISLNLQSRKEKPIIQKKRNKRNNLFFIKSSFPKDSLSLSSVKHYLKEMQRIVERELPDLKKEGFLVIQTQDVRMNGFIQPLAKQIIDSIIYDNLWLKEIIFITTENKKLEIEKQKDSFLKITHQYLIVYKVIK